jgi:hypothetical protein
MLLVNVARRYQLGGAWFYRLISRLTRDRFVKSRAVAGAVLARRTLQSCGTTAGFMAVSDENGFNAIL